MAPRHRAVIANSLSAETQDDTLPELKEELLELLDDIPARGLAVDAEDAEDILDIVGDLEQLNPFPDWAESAQLGGRWQLKFTSSKVFKNNQGLSGYARDVAGITTPELFMQIQTGYKLITYEEPIVMEVIRGHSSCTREGQRS